MKLKRDGVKGGEEGKGRTGDEAGGGMHAMVFRGPQDQEASRVSLSSKKKTRFVGTHSINNTNTQFKKFNICFTVALYGLGLVFVGVSPLCY